MIDRHRGMGVIESAGLRRQPLLHRIPQPLADRLAGAAQGLASAPDIHRQQLGHRHEVAADIGVVRLGGHVGGEQFHHHRARLAGTP